MQKKEPGRQPETRDISRQELVQKLNTLLESNKLKEALPILHSLTVQNPEDSQLQTTAGLVALSLGKPDNARQSFELALEADPKNIDALYNSALLAMAEGRADDAISYFDTVASLNPGDASIYNDLAIIWINKSNHSKAKECFTRAIELNPNYSQARKNAMEFASTNDLTDWGQELLDRNKALPGITTETLADIELWTDEISDNTETEPLISSTISEAVKVGRLTGKKVAVFANHKAFVTDIIQRLEDDNNEVLIYSDDSGESMSELLSKVDLAWFEWCDNLVIEASKLPKTCPTICRLHSYEAFTEVPTQVNWKNVDQLVFVNRSVMELVNEPSANSVPKTVIHNGVDTDRFVIPGNKTYGKKIASVGFINYKKNPSLLLYCFKKIYEYDPGFTFHIAGVHQDPRIRLYFDHFLNENPLPINFDGWIEDMSKWYEDKDYVISTSLFESFHYSIAEGT
jgi:predicted negative regulator of RcsB-dependent stress response